MAGVTVSSPANEGIVASLAPPTAADGALETPQSLVTVAVSDIGPSPSTVKFRFVLQLPAPSELVAPIRTAFAKILTVALVSAVPLTVNAPTFAALTQNPALGVVMMRSEGVAGVWLTVAEIGRAHV